MTYAEPDVEIRALHAGVDLPRIEELFARPAWQLDAACRYEEAALFFPRHGETAERARAICATCPVAAECLAWATSPPAGIAPGAIDGVWGGLTGRQRQALANTGSSSMKRARCVDCEQPCTRTRCRACFDASAFAQPA